MSNGISAVHYIIDGLGKNNGLSNCAFGKYKIFEIAFETLHDFY
jgi:hypothetical protein